MQNGETPVFLFGDDSASVFLLRWRDFVATTVCPCEVMYNQGAEAEEGRCRKE